jgi:hypothetical protein
MTTLYDATRPVKTTRRPFGSGVLPYLLCSVEPQTAADEAWLVEDNARRKADARARRRARHAAESYGLDGLEAGFVPCDPSVEDDMAAVGAAG